MNEHNQQDSALVIYGLALSKFKEIGNYSRSIESVLEISIILESQYKFEESIENLNESLNIIFIDSDTLNGLRAEIYLQLGTALEELTLYKSSIDALINALEIYEINNDSVGISSCLINLGSLLLSDGNYSDAYKYTNKALEISTLLNDKNSISVSLNNIGYIYSYTKKPEKALAYFSRSFEIDKELNDNYGMSICLNNIGDTYKDLGDTVMAISYYTKCLEIARLDSNDMLSLVLTNIGELEYNKGNLKIALASTLEGLEVANKIASFEQKLGSYSLLHKIYSEMGKYEKAYFFLSAHKALYDSTYSITKTRHIQEVSAKYNDEIQRTEISTLKEKNIGESEIRNYLLIAIIAISILIVSMFVFIKLIRRTHKQVKKQKQYFEKLLEYSEDFIFVLDNKGVAKYISPSYERRIGREIKSRVGMSAFEFIHPDDVDFVTKEFKDLSSDKRPRNINFRMEDAYGEWLTIYAYGHNMMDDPLIEGIVVNFWDITQQKRAEEQISQSEIKFREIFNSFPDIFKFSPELIFHFLPLPK